MFKTIYSLCLGLALEGSDGDKEGAIKIVKHVGKVSDLADQVRGMIKTRVLILLVYIVTVLPFWHKLFLLVLR